MLNFPQYRHVYPGTLIPPSDKSIVFMYSKCYQSKMQNVYQIVTSSLYCDFPTKPQVNWGIMNLLQHIEFIAKL